jgi:hypothetical protein
MRKATEKAYDYEIEKTEKREAIPAIHKVSAQQCIANFCTMIASIDEREKAIPLSRMTSRSRGGIVSVSAYNNFIQAYKNPTRCSLQCDTYILTLQKLHSQLALKP